MFFRKPKMTNNLISKSVYSIAAGLPNQTFVLTHVRSDVTGMIEELPNFFKVFTTVD